MKRRQWLGALGGGVTAGLAGCLGVFDDDYDGTGLRMGGWTIHNVDLTESQLDSVLETVDSHTAFSRADIGYFPNYDELYVFRDDVSHEDVATALEDTPVDVETAQFSTNIFRNYLRIYSIEALEVRLDEAGYDGSVEAVDDLQEPPQIAVQIDDVDAGEEREILDSELIDRGVVETVAGIPTAGGVDQYRLFTARGLHSIDAAQEGDDDEPPHVPVVLSTDAGTRVQEQLIEHGFTTDGVDDCPAGETPDAMHEDHYCLYTVVDGTIEAAYGLSAPLADALDANSEWGDQEPRFRIPADSFAAAQWIERFLRSGSIPADLEIHDD